MKQHQMSESVIVTGIHNINNLGVIRGLARKGISITLLDVDPSSMVRRSRFINERLICPNPHNSEAAFIEFLIKLGRRIDHQPVIIPTGDAEVMALSKHKDELDAYFRIPVSSFDIVDLLVNKKRFFLDISLKGIPCPKSYFPNSDDEARYIAGHIECPFIVKSAYSHEFIRRFHKKVFVIHSISEFETAIELLNASQLDYFLQEIIPGNSLFLFYGYFSRKSVPLGLCGYDKVRQFPIDFGIGTICRSVIRPQPINLAIKFLSDIQYHGLAEPEFKFDPRDGQFKLIEINTRSVTQTLLANACGVPVEYLAYLDLIKENVEPLTSATEGILWIDEINEMHYQFSRLRQGYFPFTELSAILKEKIVFAGAASDDPIPFLIGLAHFFYERFNSLINMNILK